MIEILDENGLIVGISDAVYTYTGRTIRPLDPNPADICIEDIAHALSQQCRYTGHTSTFYSVAEHSLLTSYVVALEMGLGRREQLQALMHDASEAYLADIARPVKKAPGFQSYLTFEAQLEDAIAHRFGLEPGQMPEYVRAADDRMLGIEISTLCHPRFQQAYGDVKPWEPAFTPAGLLPQEAKYLFLKDFYALGGTQ